MSDDNYVEKLKSIVREKKKVRRNIMCEWERGLQCEKLVTAKDEKWREEQVPHLRFVNPQLL
jgi:hypothetical protein